jgi:hypothetical protein
VLQKSELLSAPIAVFIVRWIEEEERERSMSAPNFEQVGMERSRQEQLCLAAAFCVELDADCDE